MRHHAIVVTSFKKDALGLALDYAASTGAQCSAIVPAKVNGYFSFFIAPDGSKEDWQHSNEGDNSRARVIEWLESNHSMGWFDWVEIEYGGYGGAAQITNQSMMEEQDDA